MDQLSKSIRKALCSEFLALFGGGAAIATVESHLASPLLSRQITPHTKALLNGLSDSHWLGADRPATAITTLFSSEIHKYELSQSLIKALQDAARTVQRYQEFFNSTTNPAALHTAA